VLVSCCRVVVVRSVSGNVIWGLLPTERHFTAYLGLWLGRESLSPNRHSLQIWLWGCCPYWATAPSTGAPPQGAPHTCVTGPAGISLTTPPSWIPVTVCLFSALCICTLLLMLIIQLTAHAIQLTAHASASAQAFTCFSCTCTTSRSLLPDALIDIRHNSQGLLSTHVR